jgi:uncharacterized protein
MQPDDLDPRLARIVTDVVRRAVQLVEPERIWLFGSQARGTASHSSDVDIALQIPARGRRNWSRFVLEATEELPALADIDLVDIGLCSPALALEIAGTGRIVYEARDAASA